MIHLRNVDRYASVYRDDYDRVVAQIGNSQWLVNTIKRSCGCIDRYVRAHSPASKSLVMVARIIARAEPRTAVRYLDRDVFNLRSDNLQVDMEGGNGGTKRRRYGAAAVTSEAARGL